LCHVPTCGLYSLDLCEEVDDVRRDGGRVPGGEVGELADKGDDAVQVREALLAPGLRQQA